MYMVRIHLTTLQRLAVTLAGLALLTAMAAQTTPGANALSCGSLTPAAESCPPPFAR
ncbi:hypothetical protein [Pseudoruegeria aquimaris]|uniref:hypothetical protein n=1 Tax=Pseudoruegeria aquimaris TaxID=393663 RepID=UPI001593486B|nr:hypothetical protein [Pseudoruegeria aquimaris]